MSRAAAVRRAVVVAVLATLAVSARAHAYTPSVDYALNCQGCHRADGGGTPGTIPPLAGSVSRFLAVAGGREYLAQVPGVAQAPLDDAALAAVLNWMLTRFDAAHIPTNFSAYTPEEIARLRTHPLIDVETVRMHLLAAIRGDERSQPAADQADAAVVRQ